MNRARLRAAPRLACGAPWSGCAVHHTGAVFPCCSICEDHGEPDAHAHHMRLGELTSEPLAAILGGPRAWAIRRAWAERRLDGLCCGHCAAGREHTCTPYFRDDAADAWIERAFERDDDDGAVRVVDPAPPPLTRLEVQLDSRCQLACSFCARDYTPTGDPALRGPGSIDPGLFERLLDEAQALAGERVELYVHWSGEPLLHPAFDRLMAAVAARPRFHCTVVTNGLALTPARIDTLLALPRPPAIYVSLHAADRATFAATTGADRYDEVLAHVETLLARRAAAGLQRSLYVYLGFTVVDANVDQLPEFLALGRALLGAHGETPAIHRNGRGRPADATLNVVADGTDPFSPAMRRAFWLVEEARADEQPSIGELERFAAGRPSASDDGRDLGDPASTFIEHQQRIAECELYARDPAERTRCGRLLDALLLRQAHAETVRDGHARDATIRRLLQHLDDRAATDPFAFDTAATAARALRARPGPTFARDPRWQRLVPPRRAPWSPTTPGPRFG